MNYIEREIELDSITLYKNDKNLFENNKLLLDNITWVQSTVGDSKSGENIINTNIRNSYYAKEDLKIYLHPIIYNNIFEKITNINIKFDLDLIYDKNGHYLKWKLLKYEKDGFFTKHKDGKKNNLHFGTMLILPPKTINSYKGGELVLYINNDKVIINQYEEKWKLIIFGLDVEHELNKVLEGTRYVFKSEVEYDNSTKLLIESKTYNEKVDIKKIDISKEKKIFIDYIKSHILELEKEIKNKKNILCNIENENFKNDELTDFLENANNELLRNKYYNSNIFIIPLHYYYEYPEPEKLKLDDLILFNTIFEHFTKINIKMFNIKSSVNMGDNIEQVVVDNNFGRNIRLYCMPSEDEEYDDDEKFTDLKIFYPGIYYNYKLPGECIDSENRYNDSTYDTIEIRNISFLYIELNR